VAYKRNIDDMRESPALDVILLLERRGAIVSYSDPHVPTCAWTARNSMRNPNPPPRTPIAW